MKFLPNFFRSKAAVFALSILALILVIIISLCVGVVMYSPMQLLEMPDILRYGGTPPKAINGEICFRCPDVDVINVFRIEEF